MNSDTRTELPRVLDVVIQARHARVIRYRTNGPSYTIAFTLGADGASNRFSQVRQLDAGFKIAARSETFEHDGERTALISPLVH